ncbi:uncharacterized protein LOC124270324 [Haliotis rubra]|uniref:uncharacterized protein LOC124270324 n=1 Tax=Haliotis rubra TaxID=36100 RepID=UPI001EE61248|nr:uncharacterized protein LOC124270324 [Haliotis rubra]
MFGWFTNLNFPSMFIYIYSTLIVSITMASPQTPNQLPFSTDICHTAGISPYLPKDMIPSVEFSIEVSNLFLKELEQVKCTHPDLSYICIVNTQLTAMKLLQRDRLEQHFRRICSEVCLKVRRTNSGAIRKKYVANKRRIAIFRHETESHFELADQLERCKLELVELESRCSQICGQLQAHMIDTPSVGTFRKDWEDIGARQSGRRLSLVKDEVKKVLSFLNEMGLNPRSLSLEIRGKSLTMDIGQDALSYQELDEDRRDKLRGLVAILDKYGISDAAYHELSQAFCNLPRTHTVVSEREEISQFNIRRVPGNIVGAYVSFKEDLQNILGEKLKANPSKKEFTVKIGGDGTRANKAFHMMRTFLQTLVKQASADADLLIVQAGIDCANNGNKAIVVGTWKKGLEEVSHQMNGDGKLFVASSSQ